MDSLLTGHGHQVSNAVSDTNIRLERLPLVYEKIKKKESSSSSFRDSEVYP